jgi:tripartite ATP-independent transporter DctP family solute receptor
MKHLFIAAMVAVCLLGLAPAVAQAAGGDKLEMRWYQPEPIGHAWTDVGQLICDKISEKSNGRIKITQYPAGSLGTQAEALDMLRVGSLDFLTSGPTILNPFDKNVMVFGVPYLFRDKDHAYRVMDKMGDQLFNTHILEKSGVRTLQLWWFGTRTLTINSDKPVKTPKDLDGLKVRCMTIPVYKDAVSSLGPNATPVAFTELYMALQTGVVQGQENPVPTIYAQKFYEVQNQIVLTNHTVHMGSVHVSEQSWKKVSDADKKLILGVFEEMRPEIDKRIADQSVNLLKEMESKGAQIVKPDTAAFRAHSEAYMNKKYGKVWGDLMAKIKAVK